ncbi:MAG: SpoIID/LytB domain-containing protein, partial [Clostridia bacterium]|nr:SpoIID/LytB domain-containing protein [Clostridia bacterium]
MLLYKGQNLATGGRYFMRKNHAVQKIAVILLMLCICMSAQATEVVSAQLTTRAGGTNGMVRVFLSSMGNPSTLTLTPVGSYSVNGNVSQTLTSGESVTVRFNSSTGNLTLTRGGATSDMGSSFALRRHSTSGTNGIKIAQARKPGNPYPGDLSFQAVRQSSGSYKLYTIAHIYIESYLYGVLPYEMGNGAHLEALKAQAVAARTYTLRMMNNRSSGYYDVVDTTNDQVYNGTPSGNANCVSAVDATKGIVLMYGSSLTATYYSASNGGQTESAQHVWGGSGYPYLTVKDDPFDYENAQSSVKSTTVYADGTSASQNSSLMSLLEGKAVTALNAMGYRATTSNTSIQTISAVTPHTPKYDSPSRLYTKMDFQLTARTVDGYGSTATPSITVTCDIFSELESRLGMSLQSAKNELWSVKTSGSNFVLQARRYGHGAGLSQRGAMQMGRLGYTYDQILGFYFTGCTRVQYNFSHTILSSVESGGTQTETTVEDAAELTGTDGCTGVVKLDGTSGVLAVRTEKSASSSLAGIAPASAPVTVLASDGSWCFIRYGGVKGYVPAGAITVTGTPAATTAEQPSSIIGFGTVKANGYLNLRQSGSSSAAVLTTAPTGSVLTVFSSSGGWAQVQYGATVAYASSDFLSLSSAYPGTVADSGQAGSGGGDTTLAPGETLAIVACEGEALSVFDQQSQSGNVVQQIAKGQSVVVTNRGAQWCAVRYEGATGYVLTAQLTFPSDTQTGESISAVVTTESGSLNMRMEGRAGSPILTTIPRGAQVSVKQKGAEWSA